MSESYELNGEIHFIDETKEYGSNGFQKREIVVVTEGDTDYPQLIKVEFVKDKCAILDQFSVGQNVTVKFNMRGREYNGNYYTNIQGWKIDSDDIPQDEPTPVQAQDDAGDDDNLPF